MLLIQVSMMASCRRELIEMLGVERAKGFFLRLGYQSGLKDAELARKLRPQGSDVEMFFTGPQLHSLKGMVNVRPADHRHRSGERPVLRRYRMAGLL